MLYQDKTLGHAWIGARVVARLATMLGGRRYTDLDLLAMNPRPRVVWLQLGIRNDAFARELTAAGIDVIQDRCMLADHRRLGLGRIG